MPGATIEIVNILGNVLHQEVLGHLGTGHQIHNLNVSLNAAGIYHLRMRLPNGRVLKTEFLKVN